VLEKYGISSDMDLTRTDKAECCVKIKA